MILIDTNALVILLIGLINPSLIRRHRRTSIYEEQDFYDLITLIGSFDKLTTLPNIWTEVDNLLNNSFSGEQKYKYVQEITALIKASSERLVESVKATENIHFSEIGITDSLILDYAKECDILITSDSQLSDYALAYGIYVYDLVKIRNERL